MKVYYGDVRCAECGCPLQGSGDGTLMHPLGMMCTANQVADGTYRECRNAGKHIAVPTIEAEERDHPEPVVHDLSGSAAGEAGGS